MKTAMQFLKEEIKNKIIPSSKENGELSEYQYSHNVAYGTVLTIIEYLLEKEKEQIIDAYYGKINGVFGYREEGQEYYNQAQLAANELERGNDTYKVSTEQLKLSVGRLGKLFDQIETQK